MKTIVPQFIAGVALASCVALAGRGGPGPGPHGGLPPKLAKYDTNNDGVLSAAEKAAMQADLAAQKKAFLAKYDTNGDGVLSADELAKAHADREAQEVIDRTAQFVKIDADGNGKVTLAELTTSLPGVSAARVAALFNRLDADKDGSVTLVEYTADNDAAHPSGGESARELAARTALFAKVDTDSNGKITLAELTASMPGATAAKVAAEFARLDADKDGSITLPEFTTDNDVPGGPHRGH